AASLSASSPAAATTETSAVRRCGLTWPSETEEPAEAGSPYRWLGVALGVRDVAPEHLVEHRAGALALVLPVAIEQLRRLVRPLVRSGVVVVELAVGAVHVARVHAIGTEVRVQEALAR